MIALVRSKPRFGVKSNARRTKTAWISSTPRLAQPSRFRWVPVCSLAPLRAKGLACRWYALLPSQLMTCTVQAAFRGRRERKQYENLTRVEDPPVTTVRRFLHLLDQSDADFAEELGVQQLKQKVLLLLLLLLLLLPLPLACVFLALNLLAFRWSWPFNTTAPWTMS